MSPMLVVTTGVSAMMIAELMQFLVGIDHVALPVTVDYGCTYKITACQVACSLFFETRVTSCFEKGWGFWK